MGIFDSLTNMNPEQTQGLLAFAANTLQGANTGRPMSFGGALGGGIQAYQQSMDAQRKKKIEEEQAAQIAKLTGLKIQDAESDLTNQQAQRERAEGLRKFYMSQAPGASPQGGGMPAANMGGEVFVNAASSYGLPTDNEGLNKIVNLVNQGMSPTQAAASLAGKNSPTVENSQMMQGATPSPKFQSEPAQKTTIYEQRLAQAQALRNAGYGPEADAAEAAALKFQPKVKGWEKVQQGGKVMYAPFFEDGTSGAPVPLEVAEKLEKINTGGNTELANPYTGATVRSMRNTQTPDSLASNAVSMRGQNMTDARSREANQISGGMRADAQQQKVRDENLTKQGQIASFDTMLDSLDRLNQSPGLSRSVGLYSKVPTIPGSDSANFQAELETFKSQAFLPQVAQLKGMGALSDAEGKKLSAAVGALDPSMSERAFRESIKRITDTMNTARARVVSSSRESVQQGSAPPNAGGAKAISLADIAETARKSGKSTAEVTAAARAAGYQIGGR